MHSGREERPGPVGTGGPRPRKPRLGNHRVAGLAELISGPDIRVGDPDSIPPTVVWALQALPVRQRAALLLHDAAGLPLVDVADILECDQAAVANAVRRARATLAAVTRYVDHGILPCLGAPPTPPGSQSPAAMSDCDPGARESTG